MLITHITTSGMKIYSWHQRFCVCVLFLVTDALGEASFNIFFLDLTIQL